MCVSRFEVVGRVCACVHECVVCVCRGSDVETDFETEHSTAHSNRPTQVTMIVVAVVAWAAAGSMTVVAVGADTVVTAGMGGMGIVMAAWLHASGTQGMDAPPPALRHAHTKPHLHVRTHACTHAALGHTPTTFVHNTHAHAPSKVWRCWGRRKLRGW